MASKLTGKAVVFGSPGTITVGGAAINLLPQSGDFGANHQTDEVVDGDNEVVTLAHSKELIDATLTFVPCAASPNTKENAKLSLRKPDPGAVVVLSGFHAPGAGGTDWINGAWSYVGGFKVAMRNNGVATYELQIRRHATNDITTAVS